MKTKGDPTQFGSLCIFDVLDYSSYHTQFYFLAIGMTWTLRFFQGTSDVKGDVGVSETELSRSEPNLTS